MNQKQLHKEIQKAFEKDMREMLYHEGQIQLIRNVLSTNYDNLEELKMFLKVWSSKLEKDTDEINKRWNKEDLN